MFKTPTVMILGAGASWHYGYPLGEELVDEVISRTGNLADYCSLRLSAGFNLGNTIPKFFKIPQGQIPQQAYKTVLEDCRQLAQRLRAVQPVVIDYFLGWNQPLHDLGRLMIAAALLKREAEGAGRPLEPTSEQRNGRIVYTSKHNWIRFLVHELLMECKESKDLLKNQVNFVTFNYDISLERNLRTALNAVGFLDPADVEEFLKDDRIIHVYGAMRSKGATLDDYRTLNSNYTGNDGLDLIQRATKLIDTWDDASADLLVIDPHKKEGSPTAERAKTVISGKKRLYFLGFGFDAENTRRLGFPLGQPIGRRFFITNFNNSDTVNRLAAKALGMNDLLSTDSKFVGNAPDHLQRSVRSTYDAIALDFGMFGEQSG